MPLDLDALAAGDNRRQIEPRDIFDSLGNRPWRRLRPEQTEVLKAWYDRRTQRDLVIKQNTGGGKTVVGLLIAQSSLNESVGPAAYLVPDTYLVTQVVAEAEKLGLTVTTDTRNTAFRAGNAILVCTFDKVVNGRSTFGLADSPYSTPLGTVIVDDAHAALGAARRQFTASVSREHDAYKAALTVFGDELTRQSSSGAAAMAAGDYGIPMRIPFWAWATQHARVTEALAAAASTDREKNVYFSWPLLADHAHRAVVTISREGLLLRTPCPAIEKVQAFARAHRRVYLTATLADDGILVTELGADAQSVRTPITPERATDLGDRLILAPLELNPQIHETAIREMAHQFSLGDRDGDGALDAKPINVVALVPSDKAAEHWQDYADHVLHVDDMRPVLARMVDGEHVGLVVLVNKYDGVDLPGEACRLLIIDGMPTPLDAADQREVAALAGSNTLRPRRVQRLEQGMGRGIRDAEDYCAVLLLGRDAAISLVDRADLALFSPATRAQVEFSQGLAQQIEGEGLGSVRQAVSLFLERNPQLKEASSKALAGVAYDTTGHVSSLAETRRAAWEHVVASDPSKSVTTLRSGMSDLDDIEKGWRLEELASYQHEFDPAAAQETLRAAKKLNGNVLMPVVRLPARPIRGQALQAQSCSEYLADKYENGVQLQLGVQQVLDGLVFAPGDPAVEAAEMAMKMLGLHLGFSASRPEKEQSSGPDVAWGLTPDSNAVIELKTGTTRNDTAIKKDEANQLSGSFHWNSGVGGPKKCTPVLVAKSELLSSDASLASDARVITENKLKSLKEHVLAFAIEVAQDDRWRRTDAVANALSRHDLTADRIIRAHSAKSRRSDQG